MKLLFVVLALLTLAVVVYESRYRVGKFSALAAKSESAIRRNFTSHLIIQGDSLELDFQKRLRRLEIPFSELTETDGASYYWINLPSPSVTYLRSIFKKDPEYIQLGADWHRLKQVGYQNLNIYFLDEGKVVVRMSSNNEKTNHSLQRVEEVAAKLIQSYPNAKPDSNGFRNPPEVVKQVETRSGVRRV